MLKRLYMAIIALGLMLSAAAANAAPQLSVGGGSGKSGSTVTLPLSLQSNGVQLASVSIDIQYDPSALDAPVALIGAAGQSAGKQISSNLLSPGLFRVAIAALNTTVIPDGVVATVAFTVKQGAASGGYAVTPLPSGSSPDAVDIAMTGVAGLVIVDSSAPNPGTVVINDGSELTRLTAATLSLSGADDLTAKVQYSLNNGDSWSTLVDYPAGNTLDVTLPAGDGVKTVQVRYQDAVGNTSSVISDTITLDTIAPNGTVSINAGAGVTTSGTVDLTLTDGGTPTGMRFSNDNANWSDWQTFAFSTTGWILAAGDGSRSVYAQLQDAAGNISTATISDMIIVDSSAPNPGTVVINDGSELTQLTAATLSLSGVDDLTAKVQYSLNNGTTWSTLVDYPASNTLAITLPAGDGVKTVQVRYQDAVGNTSSLISDTITLDTIAPIGTVSINAGAGATASSSVNLTLTDGGTPTGMRFSNDNATWSDWQNFATSKTGWLLATGDGSRSVYVQLQDAAGNISTATISDTIIVDSSAPNPGTVVINDGSVLTRLTAATLTLSGATDLTALKVQYSLDGGTNWSALVDYPASNTLAITLPAGEGLKTVQVRYQDAVGNTSSVISDTITLDTIAPTGTVSINAGAGGTNSGTVNLTVTGSGAPAEMRFSNDNTTWSDPETFAASKTGWLLESGDGSRSVYVQLQDAAGNVSSSTITDTITLDTAAPLPGTVVINGGSAFTRLAAATLTLGGASDLTPLKVQYSLNNGTTWSTLVDAPVSNTLTVTLPAGDGLKTVKVRYQDAGGNNSSVISDTITLDTTAPTGTVSINAGAAATSSEVLTLTLTASDPSSGVAEMMVSSNNTFTGATWVPYSATRTLTLPRIDGLKTIYVKYRDVAGNISLDYSDTITLDTTAPTGSISINNGAAATSNETLTLALAASDPGSGVAGMMISSTSNSFAGAVWESYSATRTLAISKADGLRTVYVKYRDVVGNISQVYSDTITYDAVPTGSVSINSNAAYTNKTAAILTLTRDSITTTQMRFRSFNGSAWGAWTAYSAYPASSTLPVTLAIGNGVRQVEVQYKDAAGNQSSELISDAINLDTTLPTGTLLIDQGARFNSVNLNLTLNAIDSGVGASKVSKVLVAANSLFTSGLVEVDYVTHLAYALPLSTVDGLKTVYVKYKDKAGNFSPVYSKTITLDRVAPTGTLKIAAGAVATKLSTVTLTLTGLGAPTQMRFSNDNATWSGWETFLASKTGWALAPGEGSRSVNVQLRDAAGNVSIATITDLINVDNSAPAPGAVVINAGSEFTRLAAATLTLSGATDVSALKVQYSLNGGATWSVLVAVPVSNTLAVTLPAGSGLKTVRVRYTDAVGLVSSVISDTITLDTVAPVLVIGTKVKINGDAATVDYSAAGGANGLLPLTLTVPAPTENGSGVAAIRWSTNGISWSSDQPWTGGSFAIAFPMTLPPTLGVVKTLYVKLVDKVGNFSATYTDTIKVVP